MHWIDSNHDYISSYLSIFTKFCIQFGNVSWESIVSSANWNIKIGFLRCTDVGFYFLGSGHHVFQLICTKFCIKSKISNVDYTVWTMKWKIEIGFKDNMLTNAMFLHQCNKICLSQKWWWRRFTLVHLQSQISAVPECTVIISTKLRLNCCE